MEGSLGDDTSIQEHVEIPNMFLDDAGNGGFFSLSAIALSILPFEEGVNANRYRCVSCDTRVLDTSGSGVFIPDNHGCCSLEDEEDCIRRKIKREKRERCAAW